MINFERFEKCRDRKDHKTGEVLPEQEAVVGPIEDLKDAANPEFEDIEPQKGVKVGPSEAKAAEPAESTAPSADQEVGPSEAKAAEPAESTAPSADKVDPSEAKTAEPAKSTAPTTDQEESAKAAAPSTEKAAKPSPEAPESTVSAEVGPSPAAKSEPSTEKPAQEKPANVGPSTSPKAEPSPAKAEPATQEKAAPATQKAARFPFVSWVSDGIKNLVDQFPKAGKTMRERFESVRDTVKDVGKKFFQWVYSKDIKQAEENVETLSKDNVRLEESDYKNDLKNLNNFYNHSIKGKLFDMSDHNSLISKIEKILTKADRLGPEVETGEIKASKPEDDAGPTMSRS